MVLLFIRQPGPDPGQGFVRSIQSLKPRPGSALRYARDDDRV